LRQRKLITSSANWCDLSNYPPLLVNIVEADNVSVLFLNDGSQVTIDISPERLDAAIIAQHAPPLAKLLADRSLGVYVDTMDMTADSWDLVRNHLSHSSRAAELFEPFPALWSALQASYAVVAAMPHRVYGGISHWSMYTSCPINFHVDPNRPAPWLRAQLSAREEWLFKTWVQLETGQVEVEAWQAPGHYVE
jgi:hypothetical protein